jgi:hypothetical protein
MIEHGNKVYDEIVKFDGRILNFKYKTGGSYFTVLPISDLNYRKKNPTKAKAEVKILLNRTTFIITDDWGKRTSVHIENYHEKEIAEAIKSLKEQELLTHPTHQLPG